jgi:fucose permease
MATFFLMMIYLAFIGLGLPDSVLGASWPSLHQSLNVPLEYAGILSMMTTAGTILSSFMSGRVTRRFGTGRVTTVSVLMTALALLGFSLAPSFYTLMLLTLPLGLGAGSVDAALNGYVSLHYEAKHMSWLHSFWGLGATLGPVVMSFFLVQAGGWRRGYLVIASLQLAIVALLFTTLPLWHRFNQEPEGREKSLVEEETEKTPHVYQIPGVKFAILSFFAYCAVEMTTGLWGTSFLVNIHGAAKDSAARYISLYYGGITIGRILTGFVSMKFPFKTIIRGGILSIFTGVFVLSLGVPVLFALGFPLIGLGCAPVFPGMIHETPERFGKSNAQTIIGIQMAFAYMGSTFSPALFGFLAGKGFLPYFPAYLLVFLLILLLSTESINRKMKKKEAQQKAAA